MGVGTVTEKHVKEARERIAPYIRPTPLIPFDFLSLQSKKEILLKCESLQRTGSFKIRGAANCILSQLDVAKKSGVVAASAGNHAQGVAAICHALGIKATICMPVITPAIKVMNTQRWGAKVELVGEVYDDAYAHAKTLEKEKGYLFVHPYMDSLVIAGQGTIGMELMEDPLFEGCEAVVVSVGGGGISTGIATYLRAVNPKIKIYGVAAKNSPCAWRSYHEGKMVEEKVKYTLAEGVAAKCTEQVMLDEMEKCLDDFFAVSEDSIASAVALLAEHGKLVVEGAGALPVSAILENLIPEKKIALILSGGNIDLTALSHVLRRGLVKQGRMVQLRVTVTDRPGGLAGVTRILAEKGANVVEVHHQRGSALTAFGDTKVELEIETRGPTHVDEIMHALSGSGFPVDRDV